MIQLLFVFFITLSVWSMDIGLEFALPEIKQGSIVSAVIKIDANSTQEIPLQKLKSKTFAEVLYVYDIGTPIRKEGRPYFEADAKIIFVKVPESNQLVFNEEGIAYKVFWNNVKVIPTVPEKEFLYGAFSVPQRFKAFKWILLICGLSLLSVLCFWIYKKLQTKNAKKKKLLLVKVQLFAPASYEEVVENWMNRQMFLNTFPSIDESFRKFEQNLFKVQFKPAQNDVEKKQVLEAYREFLNSIKGTLDGI